MKKRSFIIAILLAALLMVLPGCKSETMDVQSLLPRENVTQASVDFLSVGVGQNIPRISHAVADADCAVLLDEVYAAAPVTVEIPENYSPELNASHEIYLTTSLGTMSLLYDEYQNILNVPINRKVKDQAVRVYLSLRPAGLSQLLATWQQGLNTQNTPPAPDDQTEDFPPDDAQLRAALDTTLFDLVGTPIDFAPSAYAGEHASALYYALGSERRPELAQDQALVVAAPQSGETRQVSISEIVENDYYILVRVAFGEAVAGQDALPAAVLCRRADLEKGKPIVFLDGDRNVLYVQAPLGEPGAQSPIDPAQPDAGNTPDAALTQPDVTAAPTATAPPASPSTAAGGEERDDEPLQP